jgi:hypothetical protein
MTDKSSETFSGGSRKLAHPLLPQRPFANHPTGPQLQPNVCGSTVNSVPTQQLLSWEILTPETLALLPPHLSWIVSHRTVSPSRTIVA